jgi:hypothetical protein
MDDSLHRPSSTFTLKRETLAALPRERLASDSSGCAEAELRRSAPFRLTL